MDIEYPKVDQIKSSQVVDHLLKSSLDEVNMNHP